MSATQDRTTCSRCVLDSTVPGIEFDAEGVCSHCRLFDRLETRYPQGEPARERFRRLIEEMKAAGRGRKYDCVMGYSGGTDSTYCLYVAKKAGLRPLAVHFDNGWVAPVARENMEKVARRLGVDVKAVPGDWAELKTYYLAGLKASVPDLCMPCMIGISTSLYRAAVEGTEAELRARFAGRTARAWWRQGQPSRRPAGRWPARAACAGGTSTRRSPPAGRTPGAEVAQRLRPMRSIT